MFVYLQLTISQCTMVMKGVFLAKWDLAVGVKKSLKTFIFYFKNQQI